MRRKAIRRWNLRDVVDGVAGEVRFNAPLREYTSFRIGGPADVLVVPRDLDALVRLLKQADRAKCPVFVIGGTNLLVRDGGIRGVVVSLSTFTRISEEGDGVLYAEAGVGMPTMMQYATRRALSGLEWAAGIPGTVAGCVIMNAGTRLGEMRSAVKAVRVVSPKGVIADYPASALRFGYRRAKVPRGVIAGVWLQLKPASREQVGKVVKEYLHYRKATQPLTLPNAGCVFKNPEDVSAGKLVEDAGLKGLRVGDAQVSPKHANFVVNLGRARAADVLALIRQVRSVVRRRTGKTLQLELKIVGEPEKSRDASRVTRDRLGERHRI